MANTVYAVDLFAGAGGTSTGICEAVKELRRPLDLVAINHWPTAIESHSANHPEAKHICANVESLNPREVVAKGYLDILVASPECTHFSRAAGGRPKQDQKRSSAWQVLRWLELLNVDSVLVENVIEFRDWGALNSRGFPIKSKKGEIYQAWLSSIRSFGYTVEAKVLNAADFGAPTSRSRLFIAAKKGNGSIRWPEPTHSRTGSRREKWRAAREIIDWSIKGESIFTRKRPLSRRTIGRIVEGLRRFGGRELQPFIVLMEHGGGVKSIGDPLPTITTAKGGAMGLAQFVLSQASGGAPRLTDQPLPTIPAKGAHALVEPFILGQCSNYAPRSVDEPVPSILTAGKHALVEPFIEYHGGQKENEPFLLPVRGYFGQNTPKSVDEPLGTITQRGYGSLVDACIVQYNGRSGAQSVNEPLPTISTHDRFGLVQPEVDGRCLDIRFRMLQPHELAAAMGFPRRYKLCGTKTDVIRQIGNAVVVHVAKALCKSLLTKETPAKRSGNSGKR